MLYKFKSRATADLILLDAHGRRLLKIMGKDPEPQGIVTVAQIPGAVVALEAAVAAQEAQANEEGVVAGAEGAQDDGEPRDSVTLRQRAAPLIDMLQRSAAENADVVWGV